jgi:hypothetical protein
MYGKVCRRKENAEAVRTAHLLEKVKTDNHHCEENLKLTKERAADHPLLTLRPPTSTWPN